MCTTLLGAYTHVILYFHLLVKYWVIVILDLMQIHRSAIVILTCDIPPIQKCYIPSLLYALSDVKNMADQTAAVLIS